VSVFRRGLIASGTVAAMAMCASCALAGPAWAKHRPKAGPPPGPGITTIATGLDNPRDLEFGPGGLYVAEAGHGGEPGSKECLSGPTGETECIGFTSGISTIDASGQHHRVLTGLFSLAPPSGFAATGIDGVSVRGKGTLFGIETGASDFIQGSATKNLSPATVAAARAQAGRLIQANPSGHYKVVADVGHFDFQWSGEHKELVPEQFPDANPYNVLSEPGRNWVVDAASNTLDEVRANGSISVVAFIPNPLKSDAVPTCVDRGPDGAFYIGQLTGFGNGPGKSAVWRVVPGQKPEEWATGLTAVTGCGFGSDGQFYATEFSTLGWENASPEHGAETGAVVRVPPHSTSPTVIAEKLSFPGGFAAGPDGAIYISNWSIAPANSGGGPTGEVVRIVP